MHESRQPKNSCVDTDNIQSVSPQESSQRTLFDLDDLCPTREHVVPAGLRWGLVDRHHDVDGRGEFQESAEDRNDGERVPEVSFDRCLLYTSPSPRDGL